jgi:hypothetical protein
MADAINPDHYLQGGLEVFTAMEAWGLDKDTYLGTALKYIVRAGKKPQNSKAQDLRKAVRYLQQRIDVEERAEKAAELPPLRMNPADAVVGFQ